MKIASPGVLIISNTHDYSTDHVTYQLKKKGVEYLRLNRDSFSNYNFSMDPVNEIILGNTNNLKFNINSNTLKSIYFRAPIYSRSNPRNVLPIETQLSKSQWASFIRGLIIFDDILWINHPQSTYNAEIKPFQLNIAKKIGFAVPETIITNDNSNSKLFNKIAIKTLEPAIFDLGDKESFIYTNILDSKELNNHDLSISPLIIQNALIPKIDIRVTVINKKVYAVSIKHDNSGIEFDWRLQKEDLQYELINLPLKIEKLCIKLLEKLGLKFGCIDLIFHDETYFFIEINPTGEWDWLMHSLNLDIDLKIANELSM